LEDAVRFRSAVFAVGAVVSLTVAAVAADPADKCPPHPGMFSPEQRLMMFADIKAQADSGAVDPQLLRQMQRDKLKAMTDAQRAAFAADLTKRWATLSPAAQKQLEAEAKTWRDAHPHPEGGHAEGGPGAHPDCPHPGKDK
jgi:ABC-type transporter MlaC component